MVIMDAKLWMLYYNVHRKNRLGSRRVVLVIIV